MHSAFHTAFDSVEFENKGAAIPIFCCCSCELIVQRVFIYYAPRDNVWRHSLPNVQLTECILRWIHIYLGGDAGRVSWATDVADDTCGWSLLAREEQIYVNKTSTKGSRCCRIDLSSACSPVAGRFSAETSRSRLASPPERTDLSAFRITAQLLQTDAARGRYRRTTKSLFRMSVNKRLKLL